VKNRKCIFNLKVKNGNIAKFVIRKDYKIVFLELDRLRPTFKWNYSRNELLRYSISHLKYEMVSFLFEKTSKKKLLNVRISTLIMNTALNTKDDDMVLKVSGLLKIKLPPKFLSFKSMILQKQYKDAVKKVYNRNDRDVVIIHEKNVEEILDVLVKRKELTMIKFVIQNYDGETIGETPLLRAMKTGLQDISKFLILTEKFNVTILQNKPVILAAENGWIETIKMIVKQGGDPSAQDNTAIVTASRNGNYEVVKLLMTHKLVVPSDMDNYAYDEAVRNGFTEIASLLLTDFGVKNFEIQKKYSHVL